jgi:hypothetical protein
MKNYWTTTFRRLAAGAAIAGATAFSSAMCYANAFDVATNPPYADGWQAGDNGGSGFGPWDFTGTYNSPVGQTIDTASPYNNIGTAWTLYNADGPNQGPDNPPSGGTDISQAGRAIVGNLQVGQTVSVVVDNPIERQFFRGYTVRLNTGGGNTVYAGTPATRFAMGTFEYFTNGQWYSTDGSPSLFDTDTDAGLRLDFTLTGVDTFSMTMTPLDNPGAAYSDSGTLTGPAGSAIDWIEFEFYNTDSDFNPTTVGGALATDFYISSMSVVPEPATGVLLVLGAGALLGLGTGRKRNRE